MLTKSVFFMTSLFLLFWSRGSFTMIDRLLIIAIWEYHIFKWNIYKPPLIINCASVGYKLTLSYKRKAYISWLSGILRKKWNKKLHQKVMHRNYEWRNLCRDKINTWAVIPLVGCPAVCLVTISKTVDYIT